MAFNQQILGQSFPGPTGPVTIYTPTAGKEGLIRFVTVANVLGATGPSSLFRMFLDPNKSSNPTFDPSTALYFDQAVGSGKTFNRRVTWGINRRTGPTGPAGSLGVQSITASSLTFTIFGREDDAT